MFRDKDILLNSFDDIKILQQYLYMSEEHFITVKNKLNVSLRITMDANLDYWCQVSSNRNTPKLKYNQDMDLNKQLYLINQLKEQPAIQYPDRFESRWEELKTITLDNLAVNMGL